MTVFFLVTPGRLPIINLKLLADITWQLGGVIACAGCAVVQQKL